MSDNNDTKKFARFYPSFDSYRGSEESGDLDGEIAEYVEETRQQLI